MINNYKSKDRPSLNEILPLLKNNDYKLFDSNDSEIDEIKDFVKHHKRNFPDY
mgnify:CR=1 FL=1